MKKIAVASQYCSELQEILAEIAFEFDLFTEAAQFTAQFHHQLYSLVLLDVGLSSAALLAELHATSPETLIILLASPEERYQALEQLQMGVYDYLLLPLDASEVILKVKRILDEQSLKQKNSTFFDDVPTGLLILNEATQEMIQTLELAAAQRVILAKARQVTQAEVAQIYLADKRGHLTESQTDSLPGAEKLIDNELVLKLVQQAALTQTVISQRLTYEMSESSQVTTSVQVNPIISREKLIGVLALISRSADFSTQLKQWLAIFCSQAAIAIENAYLFQDLSSAYIDLAQSREKILHSHNTLQVIFDGISDGLYILDQDLSISTLNRIEAERQGCKPEELVGRSYLLLDGPNDAPGLITQIREALRTGQETTWTSPQDESNLYLKDREFHIYPIRNRLAQSEQVVVFAQDVSERRRWQASLFRSANLAAVGQLAGSVAHQINNPLTVTMTNSQLILLDTEPETETYEMATGILKAGERIQNIITNLLEFSNQERYFFILTDLVETIDGALALVIRSLKKANIKIINDYQAQPMLSASVSHLKLVWINLLLNARDAMTNLPRQPQITISTRFVSERMVKVVITDNGTGIAAKDLDQLFRPFFTTKPVGKALGLGLYSAHAIVERHNGQIKVSSVPNVATTFEVILPLDNPRDL
ncbi:MAG: PAS domain-containing protein [Anaerolineae bacterium]|nr:PAS domain-containing protein [Anaerolineae bacterium]MCB0176643.1 PAS domain-containing protein [Anaerolineae bacterium]MCB9109199.1 PAS domain-containing protein [Anaerolineales bacterium]